MVDSGAKGAGIHQQPRSSMQWFTVEGWNAAQSTKRCFIAAILTLVAAVFLWRLFMRPLRLVLMSKTAQATAIRDRAEVRRPQQLHRDHPRRHRAQAQRGTYLESRALRQPHRPAQPNALLRPAAASGSRFTPATPGLQGRHRRGSRGTLFVDRCTSHDSRTTNHVLDHGQLRFELEFLMI